MTHSLEELFVFTGLVPLVVDDIMWADFQMYLNMDLGSSYMQDSPRNLSQITHFT